MSKQAGRMSQSANDFLEPKPVTSLTATDVGTSRPFNNGSATVSWTLPSDSPAATSYDVTTTPTTTTTNVATTSATITGLSSEVSYTVTVVAKNASGNSAGTTSSSFTATTVPQAPSVSAVDVGTNRAFNNGAATVTITANATGGKTISNYGATPSGLSETTNASSPVTPAGMASATGYTFTGRVYNANGWSESSSPTASVTITTVPAAPTGLSAATNGQNNNRASWTAPSNGGKAISSYNVFDNGGNAPDSINTAGTTADFTGQADNFGWFFNVEAINANGTSARSTNSNQITTTPFSFVPFSFTPFGFTPFGFTPFGFTPFGFTPFGFTPFGFTPFGFTPFGFTPYGFSGGLCFKSLGATTMVQTTNGLVAAHDLAVGDVLLSADIETMPTEFPGPQSEYPDWSVVDPTVTPKTTTITSIATRNSSTIIVVNGETYADSHYIFVKRDGLSKFVNVSELLLTDLVFSSDTKEWVEVIQVDVIPNVSYPVVCINTEPYDVFYTERFLVHDSYTIASDNPVVGQ